MSKLPDHGSLATQSAARSRLNIAVIDDSKSVLLAVHRILDELENVSVVTFIDPEAALRACEVTNFDLVLVDYTMPKYNGIEVIRILKRRGAYRLVPIVMITSETERSIQLEAIEAGATEFLRKPFDGVELKARARNLLSLRQAQLELTMRSAGLEKAVLEATRDLAAREEEIIWRLALAIEYRDGATGDHVSRVADICLILAKDLGLDDHQARMIYLAAPLHDIGKIGIADEILSKPGRLTDDEIAQMRLHVNIGRRILENGSSELVRVAEAIASGHHEKWDGSGYPDGLSGEDIPLSARIVAVADVFEALCSERTYKKAWLLETAFAEILSQSGAHFDPACVEAFKRQWQNISAIMTGSHVPLAPQAGEADAAPQSSTEDKATACPDKRVAQL